MTCIINNIRSATSKIGTGLFQPLFMLDINVYYKQNRDMHRLKEAKISHSYHSIPFAIKKSAVVLFLAEVLYKSLKEEAANYELFDFIWDALLYFDDASEDHSFHIKFLMQLTRYLGFSPYNNYSSENECFDLLNGKYISYTAPHSYSYCLSLELSKQWNVLQHSSIETTVVTTNTLRREILEALLLYYNIHMESVSGIESHKILKEIFN